MSKEATNWAWDRKVPLGEKIVLLALADLHNSSTGQCWPNQTLLETLLTERTGLRGHQLHRALESLKQRRLIALEAFVSADGKIDSQRQNYTLALK